MRPSPPTSSPRRQPPDAAGARDAGRWLALIAAVAATAALVVGPASASSSAAKPRVTVIGDSIAGSFAYVPAATKVLGKGLDLRADAVVCRRLVAESCTFQGSRPSTALQVVQSRGSALGKVVVMDVGYNDWAPGYDVERVMRALSATGVRAVVWVTLRETTSNYASSNAAVRRAARHWPKLVVADWNAYSRGHAWFREDGLHLTPSGAVALARFLRTFVLSALGS